MTEILERISLTKGFRPRIPISKAKIDAAEIELGVTFSKEYRSCLEKFGAFSVFGHEFMGVSECARLDIIKITIEQRSINGDIPSDWYVVEKTNIDGITIWQNYGGEIYCKIPNIPLRKIANSLLEYIEYQMETEMV